MPRTVRFSFCSKCGGNIRSDNSFCGLCGTPVPAFNAGITIPCKVCDIGSLDSRRVYRMSGPAVAIGYILLIPSIFGMFACALIVTMTFGRGFLGEDKPDAMLLGISGVGFIFGISCFVAGLLGWLLVMKKKILKCSLCGAVIQAS